MAQIVGKIVGKSKPILKPADSLGIYGDPNGNRTRAAAVKGRCPNR